MNRILFLYLLRNYFCFSSPLFAFVGFYAAFIIGEGVYRYFNGDIEGRLFFQAVADQTIVISLGLLLMFFLIWIAGARPYKNGMTRSIESDLGTYRVRIRCGLAISIALLLIISVASGINPLSNPLGFRQKIQGGGNAYILFAFMFYFKLYGIYYFDRVRSNLSSYVDHGFMVVSVLFSFVSGFASMFAYFFLTGMLYFSSFYGTRVIRWYVMLGAVFLIILTPVYTVVRELLGSQAGIDLQVFVVLFDKFDRDFFGVIYDRFDYYDNVVAGSDVARLKQDFTYIFNLLAQPLPRSLFVDKPNNFSTLMTGWVYPSVLEIGVTANFGFVSEFLLYFGPLGLLVGGVYFGVILYVTQVCLFKARVSKTAAIFYCMVAWPYFVSFPSGYINDAGIPVLIINYIFWKFVFRRFKQTKSSNFRVVAPDQKVAELSLGRSL